MTFFLYFFLNLYFKTIKGKRNIDSLDCVQSKITTQIKLNCRKMIFNNFYTENIIRNKRKFEKQFNMK